MHPMTNIAVRAARNAGKILQQYFEHVDSLTITNKGKNDFVTDVDKAAEQSIIASLKKAYPDHSILGEETGLQSGNDFQWIIDPLDGTTNYLHGFPQFSISIACTYKGILEHAVIFDPMRDEMYVASRGSGAYLNDRRLRVTQRKSLNETLIGTGFPYRDFSYMDEYMAMCKDIAQVTAGIRRPGSAALDLAYVAAGRLDGFWEFGLQSWDLAAGALLVKEAGGVASDPSGGQNFLNSGNIVAGGLKVQQSLLATIKPHLIEKLKT